MTREEYKENLIRMFDSLRTKYKGESACAGIRCADCPFYGKVCNATDTAMLMFHVHEAVEIVEQWAKENQVVTNADKFKEVFGFEPNVFADNEKHILCNGYRTIDEKFWDAEYKGQPKE